MIYLIILYHPMYIHLPISLKVYWKGLDATKCVVSCSMNSPMEIPWVATAVSGSKTIPFREYSDARNLKDGVFGVGPRKKGRVVISGHGLGKPKTKTRELQDLDSRPSQVVPRAPVKLGRGQEDISKFQQRQAGAPRFYIHCYAALDMATPFSNAMQACLLLGCASASPALYSPVCHTSSTGSLGLGPP